MTNKHNAIQPNQHTCTRRACLGGMVSTAGLGSVDAAAFAQTPTGYTPKRLTAEAASDDLALMRRALETIHPGLHRRTPVAALTQAFESAADALRAPTDELTLYRVLSEILAKIRCTHTKAEQPPAFEDWRQTNPSHLPFRFHILEGRMIVAAAADPTALPHGAEILSINGRRVSRLIESLGAFVPIDGETVWSRATNLADDSDLMGADFDHFYPYVYGQSADFDLTLRTHSRATVRRVRQPALSFTDWKKLPNDGRPYLSNFADTTTWRMLDAEVGYLRVETFVNYRRPADAQALFTRAMTELRAGGMQRLVLDLRVCGGGSDDAALALLDHLALRPYTYQRAIRLKAIRYGDLPQYIETWGDRDALFNPPEANFTKNADGQFERLPAAYPAVLLPREPAAAAFTGPVAVLTSPVNASGATMVIAKLRDENRVTLIGEPSGGSADGPTAGQIFGLRLPNSGIKVRIPLAFNAMNVTRFDPRGGVQPDRLVPRTIADYRAGIDRVLLTAQTWRS